MNLAIKRNTLIIILFLMILFLKMKKQLFLILGSQLSPCQFNSVLIQQVFIEHIV